MVHRDMEDSGIDSGDHHGDAHLEVANRMFIGVSDSSSADSGHSPNRVTLPSAVRDKLSIATVDAMSNSNNIAPTSGRKAAQPHHGPPAAAVATTSRQLQRRLEARIEHARRQHSTLQLQQQQRQLDTSHKDGGGGLNHPAGAAQSCSGSSSTGSLIPIERLQIPRSAKDQQQPLVQWEDSDDSEEDIINFFPLSRKEPRVHHELNTDTFSIEEMSISGDDDDDEGEDLHLVPPQTSYRTVTCCPFTACAIL